MDTLTMNTLMKFRWKVLEHTPYSPNIYPRKFHIFGQLKTVLKYCHFYLTATSESMFETGTNLSQRISMSRVFIGWGKSGTSSCVTLEIMFKTDHSFHYVASILVFI